MGSEDDRYYRGNKHLKACNVEIEWTEEQLAEYKKCANDVKYFLNNYVKITTLDEGRVQFKPYEFQERMIEKFHNNRFVIAKCPRQVGKTTVADAYILHYILFNENVNVAILANKHNTAKNILADLKDMFMDLPFWLQQGVETWNKTSIEIENGSKVMSAATSKDAIRGDTYNLVFCDEFAHIDNGMAADFMSAVIPTISSGTKSKMIVISTPNGLNHFHKLWADAEQKRNKFVPVSVNWWEVPGRDEAWSDEQRALLGDIKFAQEVEVKFVGSSDTLINAKTLQNQVYVPPILEKDKLKVYEKPKENGKYMAVVDIAEGGENDYSVISIFDITEVPYKHVCVYRDNTISTLQLPTILFSMCRHYNDAHVLIEINKGKEVAISMWYDHEYQKILGTTNKKFKKQTLLLGISNQAGTEYGVKTTASVKRTGCNNLKALVEDEKLITNDHDTINEMHRFVSKGKSFAAQDNQDTDDIMMTLVLFAWATSDNLFKEITETNVQNQIHQQQINSTPFGFHSIQGSLNDVNNCYMNPSYTDENMSTEEYMRNQYSHIFDYFEKP